MRLVHIKSRIRDQAGVQGLNDRLIDIEFSIGGKSFTVIVHVASEIYKKIQNPKSVPTTSCD